MNQTYLLHISAEILLLTQPAILQNLCLKSDALIIGIILLITHLNCINSRSSSVLGPLGLHSAAILHRSVINVFINHFENLHQSRCKADCETSAQSPAGCPFSCSCQINRCTCLVIMHRIWPIPFRLSHGFIFSIIPLPISTVSYSSSLSRCLSSSDQPTQSFLFCFFWEALLYHISVTT